METAGACLCRIYKTHKIKSMKTLCIYVYVALEFNKQTKTWKKECL